MCKVNIYIPQMAFHHHYTPANVGGLVAKCMYLLGETLDKGKTVAYGVVAKGNGEAWVILEKHMTISAGGGMPGQSYPCALVRVATENENELPKDNRTADGK